MDHHHGKLPDHQVSRWQKAQAYIVVLGGILIMLSVGALFAWGNIQGYLASYMTYMHYNKDPSSHPMDKVKKKYESFNDELVWVYTASISFFAFASPVGGTLELKLGPRIASFIGLLFAVGSTFLAYFVCDSFILMLAGYGILFGIAGGISYTPPVVVALRWWPHNRALASSLVTLGYSCATVWVDYVESAYINPNNKSESYDCGYVYETEIMERFPNIFLILGSIFAVMMLIGVLLMSNPPEGYGIATNIIDITDAHDTTEIKDLIRKSFEARRASSIISGTHTKNVIMRESRGDSILSFQSSDAFTTYTQPIRFGTYLEPVQEIDMNNAKNHYLRNRAKHKQHKHNKHSKHRPKSFDKSKKYSKNDYGDFALLPTAATRSPRSDESSIHTKSDSSDSNSSNMGSSSNESDHSDVDLADADDSVINNKSNTAKNKKKIIKFRNKKGNKGNKGQKLLSNSSQNDQIGYDSLGSFGGNNDSLIRRPGGQYDSFGPAGVVRTGTADDMTMSPDSAGRARGMSPYSSKPRVPAGYDSETNDTPTNFNKSPNVAYAQYIPDSFIKLDIESDSENEHQMQIVVTQSPGGPSEHYNNKRGGTNKNKNKSHKKHTKHSTMRRSSTKPTGPRRKTTIVQIPSNKQELITFMQDNIDQFSFTFKEAVTSLRFYHICGIDFLNTMVIAFVVGQWKLFGSSKGGLDINDDSFLTIVGSVGSFFSGAGRILFAVFFDYSKSFRLTMSVVTSLMFTFMGTLGLLSAIFSGMSEGLIKIQFIIWISVLNMCAGGGYATYASAVSQTFGIKNSGVIMGCLFFAEVPASIGESLLYDYKDGIGGWLGLTLIIAGGAGVSTLLAMTFSTDNGKKVRFLKENDAWHLRKEKD